MSLAPRFLAAINFFDLGAQVAGGFVPHTRMHLAFAKSGHSRAAPPKVRFCASSLGVKHCAPPDSVQFGVPKRLAKRLKTLIQEPRLVPRAMTTASGPDSSLIRDSFSATSVRASSQVASFHLPSPLLPALISGTFNLPGWLRSCTDAMHFGQIAPWVTGSSLSGRISLTTPSSSRTITPHWLWPQIQQHVLTYWDPGSPANAFEFAGVEEPVEDRDWETLVDMVPFTSRKQNL